jgi:hypothetical protein
VVPRMLLDSIIGPGCKDTATNAFWGFEMLLSLHARTRGQTVL